MNLKLPRFAEPLFKPYRYKVLAGGRGSAKSETVARALLSIGKTKKLRVLCGREFQNSIRESVHSLLVKIIDELKWGDFYKITDSSIYAPNGTEFIFKGIRLNIQSIKSMNDIDILWLEEAATISKSSWDVLVPTIRNNDSEIWVTFNPESEDDPTYTMFFDKHGNPIDRDDACILKVNWDMNPWFPDILKKEKDYLYEVNPDLADHVWGGACRSHSDAQIMNGKWVIREFEIEDHFDGPYLGADFGFSVDPSTLVKIYLDLHSREILIRNARFGFHVELDDLPAMYDLVPGSRETLIRADGARPETISYLARKGFIIEAAEKWTGSVEDGIEFIKSFKKVVIHPDCLTETNKEKYTIQTEAKNYSYKVDRLTQAVLTDVVDAYNHGWDGVRYSLDSLIRAGAANLFDLM